MIGIEKEFIVTAGSSEHKKVLSINGRTAKLIWYSYEGMQFEFTGVANLKFVSRIETKQYKEMEALFLKGHSSFLANEDRKRAHRISLAKSIDHRKTVRTLYP